MRAVNADWRRIYAAIKLGQDYFLAESRSHIDKKSPTIYALAVEKATQPTECGSSETAPAMTVCFVNVVISLCRFRCSLLGRGNRGRKEMN